MNVGLIAGTPAVLATAPEPIPGGFDYAALPDGDAAHVLRARDAVRVHHRRGCESVVAIGRALLDAKGRLPRGQFGRWLDAEFGWSERTARNYMSAAEVFDGLDPATLAAIEPTALYMLAATSTPDDVCEDFIGQAERGESVTVREVREALAGLAPDRRTDPIAALVRAAYGAYGDGAGRTLLGFGRNGNAGAFRRQIESYSDDERGDVAQALTAFGAACVEAARPYVNGGRR